MGPVTPASGYGSEPGYGPFHLAEPGSGAGSPPVGAPDPPAEPVADGRPGPAASDAAPAAGPRPSPASADGVSSAGPWPSSAAHDAAPGGLVSAGDPTAGLPAWSAADPVSGDAADPYGFGSGAPFGASGRPRIEPSPKPEANRFLLPLLAGLLAGLVFGTGGWFLGRTTASPAEPTTTSRPPAPAPTAGAYEQNQIAINSPKLTGALATVSQGWLPRLSGCSRSGDKGGPDLNDGEKSRVRCEMDAMSVIFVEYSSAAERDKAHATTLAQNVDARELAPGVAPAGERATPSGRTSGNYVEYAYQASGRTVSAIWWDDAGSPVAAYLLAFWKDGAREKWEPMRDVWADYA
jgi:hypothetical protein